MASGLTPLMLAACLLLLLPVRLPAAQTVIVGLYDNPPIVSTGPGGRPRGLMIDVLQAVAEAEGWDLNYIHGSWEECLHRLESGVIDVLPGVAWTPERARTMVFNRDTLLTNWGQVFATDPGPLESFLDLEGKRIAFLRGDVHSRALRRMLASFKVTFTPLMFDGYDRVFEAVIRGRADAGVANRFYGLRRAADFGLTETPIIFNPIELRYALYPLRAESLLPPLDKRIKTYLEDPDSVYHSAVSRWLHLAKTKRMVEPWLAYALAGLIALLALFSVLGVLLRRQVRLRTEELAASNLELRREVEEKKRAEEALRTAEAGYRSIFEQAPVGIFQSSLDGEIIVANPRLAHIYGYLDPEDFIASVAHVPTQLYRRPGRWQELVRRVREEGFAFDFEAEMIRKDGTTVLTSRDVHLVTGPDGGLRLEGFVSDVTERKQAEEKLVSALHEKEVMLREIHHRVKNNLQIMSSLLNLQSQLMDDESLSMVIVQMQNRLRTMGLVHETLYSAGDLSHIEFHTYVRRLAELVGRSYSDGRTNVGLQTDLSEVTLDLDRAVPCGLLLNELVSNAYKHAFPQGRPGTVIVKLARRAGSVVLSVSDDGVGLPEHLDPNEDSSSLGMQLIAALSDQLGAETTIQRGNGTRFTVTFPASLP